MKYLAGHIEDLIHAAKETPKSESRNRMISHLKDALAHAKVQEMEAKQYYGIDPAQPGADKSVDINHLNPLLGVECICPPGARNRSCVAVVHNS